MARHKPPQEHENHERWLVSYADFITLMFAFFVVMYASSQADRGKAHQFSESVERALEEGKLTARLAQMLTGYRPGPPVPGPAKPAPAARGKMPELTPELERLTAELQDEIASGKIQINLEPRGLVISLKEAAFFPSGDDTVASEGYSVVETVAKTIKKVANPVRLEGHTDSMPIHNQRFRNNWELSAARSIAMLQLLNEMFAVPVNRMAAVAYAETMPVDSNDSHIGRARNRRVDIAILNESAASREAHPVAAK